MCIISRTGTNTAVIVSTSIIMTEIFVRSDDSTKTTIRSAVLPGL